MMIDRYIFRLWLSPFLGFLLIVTGVLLLSRALKVLGQLTDHGVGMEIMGTMLMAALPYFLTLTLPVAFFLAGQFVLVKLQQDSELDAFRASGVNSIRVSRVFILASVVLWGALSYSSMEWMPKGQKTFEGLVYAVQQAKSAPGFTPQRFNNDLDAFTVYVDGEGADRSYQGFILEDGRSSPSVLYVAEQARLIKEGRELKIILEQGTRFEGGGDSIRGLSFSKYTVAIDAGEMGLLKVPQWRNRVYQMSWTELNKERKLHDSVSVQAEWHWRLLLPTTVFVLCAFLIPVSNTPKRSGKSGAFGLGVLLLLVIYNVQIVLHHQAAAGHLGVWSMWLGQFVFLISGLDLTRRVVTDRIPQFIQGMAEWQYMIHEWAVRTLALRRGE